MAEVGVAAGGRVRVLGGFAAFGAFWGAWGAALPAVRAHASVDDGQLGVALLCIGDGALVPARASLRHLPRILLVLGALCALAFFVENAWQSWGAVHLESDLDASPALGALAPALFAGSAAAARFGGHGIAGRVREVTLLRAGALIGAAGTLLAALAPVAGVALAGVALAGGGISICAPILFSLAGRGADEAVRGAAVSIVTTIAYLGFLVGPAAVGLLADATTLRTSLACGGAVALLLAALAGRARPGPPPHQAPEH